MSRGANGASSRAPRRIRRVASILLSGALLGNSVLCLDESTRVLCFDDASVQERARDENVVVFATSTNIWRVERRLGAIVALRSDDTTPLWSPSGIVYRALPLRVERPFVFSDPITCTELGGLVYFQFSELVRAGNSTSSSSKLIRQGRIVVVDPRKEGRVVWFVRGEDVDRLFTASSATADAETTSCQFVETPRSSSNNEIQLVAERDRRRLELTLDAYSGKLISYRAL